MRLTDLFESNVISFAAHKKTNDDKYHAAMCKQSIASGGIGYGQSELTECPLCMQPDCNGDCIYNYLGTFDQDNVVESLSDDEDFVCEGAKIAWARSGRKVVKKYRCTSGRRKGRIVANPSQCSKPIDLKKRATLRKTKARLGSKMIRKSKKTRRINPASKRLKTLNRRR